MFNRSRSRNRRSQGRSPLIFEALESRTMLAVLIGNGGQGGTTQSTPLTEGLNLVQFQWENFTIPDEFQILHQGMRIAGDVGLQSGGNQGSTVVTADSGSDQLTVKVTAPLQGTAWNFRVEVSPFELNVTGFLGDVIKVDLVELLNKAGVSLADADLKPDDFGLQSLTNNRGRVAQIDKFQDELKKGVFYFIPTVTGNILDYDASRNDMGLGESMLTVTNNGHEFPVEFDVIVGASTSGDDAVSFGKKKLDIFRQQQRLAYLGFPGSAGNSLVIDGASGTNTVWAKKMFSVATDPAAIRPTVPNSGTQYFKTNINSPNAPVWNRVDNIPNVTIVSRNGRFFGIHTTGDIFDTAEFLAGPGVAITSTGASNSRGTAPPSTSHDAGRGIDIDNIPAPYLFSIVGHPGVPGGYVGAPGPRGSIVVRDGGSYRVGNVSVPADRAPGHGLRTARLAESSDATLANQLDALGLLDYAQDEADVRNLLEAFTGAGVISSLYNDPRFIGETINGVTIRFWPGHFNHMHFNIPNPITTGPPSFARTAPQLVGLGLTVSGAVDLGRLDDNQSVSGSLDAANPEQVYRFEIGEVESSEIEREFFDTPRDLTLVLDGLGADADLQLLEDLNENGVFEEDEVLYDSLTDGAAAETIDALQLPIGEYFVRVLGQGVDTDFDLSLSLAPLPVPTDNAGNALADASDLGVLNGTVNLSDFIGEVDTHDFYRFEINEISDVALSVTGLSLGDVSLSLGQDANGDGTLDPGELLAVSDEEGEDAESIQLALLPVGVYFVHVGRVSGNSDYQIRVSPTTSTIPADPAGDTIATALDAGPLSTALNFNGFVGDLDAIDIYKFSVSSVTGLTAELSGLTADADLIISRDSNGDGELDSSEVLAASELAGTSTEVIAITGLAPGDYYVSVNQYEGNTNYSLTLSPNTPTGADLAVMREVVSPTPDLGEQFSYMVTVTNNGPDTAADVVLTETLPVGLELIQAFGQSSTVQVSGSSIMASMPSLASGQSESITIVANSFLTGDLLGSTSATASTSDYDLANNSLVQSVFISPIVSPEADLELTQTVSDTSPTVGDQITFTLILANQGPGTATVIRVGDTLPAGVTYVSSNADLGSYDSTTGIWNVGNMPPNASVNLEIVVEVVSATTLVNSAEVIAVDESDPDSTPNNNVESEDDQSSVSINVQAAGPTISMFTLYDADTNQPIQTINDGEVIDLDVLPTHNLNIRAEGASDSVESVRFTFDGRNKRSDSVEPYALFSRLGRLFGDDLETGVHVLSATPYSKNFGRGDEGTPLEISFTVVRSSLLVTSFSLINADTGEPIQTINDGDVIDLDVLPTHNLNIRAEGASDSVESVRFTFDGRNKRSDSVEPYALFSRLGRLFGDDLETGVHVLSATPYSKNFGRGDEGTPLEISFTVVRSSLLVAGLTVRTEKDATSLKDFIGLGPDVKGIRDEFFPIVPAAESSLRQLPSVERDQESSLRLLASGSKQDGDFIESELGVQRSLETINWTESVDELFSNF